MAWQHLDQQRPQAHALWNARCWVNGDRKCAFMTFTIEADLRMRVYDAASGDLLAESPPNRSRKRSRPEAKR